LFNLSFAGWQKKKQILACWRSLAQAGTDKKKKILRIRTDPYGSVRILAGAGWQTKKQILAASQQYF
jgi:hypothetical protein